MKIDSFDDVLQNQCDYRYKDSIKFILKNYWTFQQLKNKGNATAIVIMLDITNAICNLKKRQKECIIMYFIQQYTYEDVGEKLNIRKQTVAEHIRKAIRNIMIFLEGKKVIESLEIAEKLRGEDDGCR